MLGFQNADDDGDDGDGDDDDDDDDDDDVQAIDGDESQTLSPSPVGALYEKRTRGGSVIKFVIVSGRFCALLQRSASVNCFVFVFLVFIVFVFFLLSLFFFSFSFFV